MNGLQSTSKNALPNSFSRGVFFIVVSDTDEIVFCSPICAEEYGFSTGSKIEWLKSGDKSSIKLPAEKEALLKVDQVAVRAVFDQAWHGKKARMLLLDESPYRNRVLNEFSTGKVFPYTSSFLPWISFKCKYDSSLEMIAIADLPEELTGYTAEQLLSKSATSFRNLIPKAERQEIWKTINASIQEGKPYQVIYSFRTATNQIRWFQEQGQARKNKDGTVENLKGWIIDLTERKRISEELVESEGRYRSLVEASPDSVLILDNNGSILLANQQFCDLIGEPVTESVLGKDIGQFFNTIINGQSFNTIEEVITSLPPGGSRLVLELKKGNKIPVELNLSRIKNAGGKTYAYIAIGRDLRKREEAQLALSESEARYRAIVEENPEMVVRFDQNHNITFANAAFCKYLNVPLPELIGKPLGQKVTGPGHHLLEKIMAQFSTDMTTVENEFALRNSKGGETWYRWKTIAIKDTNGRFIEYQAIGEDITNQKKAHLIELDSQNRLREIMENIKLIAIILNADGTLVFCNSYFLEVVGWSREEVLQKDWISTFIPNDCAERIRSILFNPAARGKTPIRNENPILTRTGERRLIAWYNTSLRNSRGEYEGMASIGEDITEKHLSEKIQEAILKIAQSTNEAEDLDSLYQSIQDALRELMPVDNFFIALYDDEKDILSFPFYRDEFDQQPEPGKPRRGLTEYVLRTGKAMLVNPEEFEQLIAAGEVESIGAPSLDWIGVPLKLGNQTIGVMGAQTYSPGVRYGPKEEQLLTIVSNQVAMAIDRKRAEQALRNSQKRNELLVAASKDAIFTGTMGGRIIDSNDVALEMYGYKREEVLKLSIEDLLADEVWEAHPDFVKWILAEGGEARDLPSKRKDGSVIPTDVSVRQALTEEGPVLIAYVRDISEQKQAAQVIVESEEKFRALAENSAAGIFIHSGGRNIYVNPTWSAITEYSILELLQKKPIDFVDPSLPRSEKERISARLKGMKIPDRFEFNIVTRSGENKVIDLHITSIRFEEKDTIMGTAIDITNRKQREHELEVIAQMSEALRISVHRSDVLETSISTISDILKIDGAYLAMVDPALSQVQMVIASGIWKVLEGTTVAVDQGLAGHIITTGETYVNHTPQDDPYITRPDLAVNLKSIAGVPLIAAGRTIGVLVVGTKKPITDNDIRLLRAMGDFTASALHRADLFEQSSLQAKELSQAYNSTLEGWALALELRDKETQGHSVRITNLTLKLARRMGISEAEMENIRRGALLHDIGKLGVPDTILLKHSSLTPSEWAVMQKHPAYAFEMLSQLKDFKDSIDIPYCHHEWWDGSGYPRGLEGNDIPLAARIFCIVDVWDALTSDRPYRQAWDKNEALAHIINQAGTHFDPHVVNEFIKMIVEDK